MKHESIAIGRYQPASTRASRSWPLWLGCAAMAMALSATEAAPQASGESWFFSAAGIEAAFQYQESNGARIRNSLPAFGCMAGQGDFAAVYQQSSVRLPCRFVHQVTQHLKAMLNIGAAGFLFPLDADHAHLGVPTEVWAEKYSKLAAAPSMAALLREPRFVALYHTAEPLDHGVGDKGQDDAAVQRWRAQRNVQGYFDGRPLQVLTPHPEGFGVGMPEGLAGYGGFNFLASSRGESMLLHGARAIAFDVSLEMAELDPGVFGRSMVRAAPAASAAGRR